jgi:hypothetical protein
MKMTPGKGAQNRTANEAICAIQDSQMALTKNDEEPTSFTPVRNEADSPQPILRPSPVTGLDPNIFDVEKPYLGYDAETCPYQQPQRIMWTYFHRLNR